MNDPIFTSVFVLVWPTFLTTLLLLFSIKIVSRRKAQLKVVKVCVALVNPVIGGGYSKCTEVLCS